MFTGLIGLSVSLLGLGKTGVKETKEEHLVKQLVELLMPCSNNLTDFDKRGGTRLE